jgi:tape measure domain-containing protein
MSAASGKSIAEVMPNAARVLGQISSKGKLQTEELNQLAESVGLSRDKIRKQLGLSRDDFEKSFTPGNAIPADKALPAIKRAMDAQAKGAADLLSQTTSGRIDRLKEVTGRAMADLTRPLYDRAGGGAGGIADALQGVNWKGVSKDVGDTLSKGFQKAKQGVSAFLEAIKPAKPLWDNVLKPFLMGFAGGVMASVVGAAKVLWVAFKGLMIAAGWVGTKLAPLKGVFAGIGAIVGFVFGGPILKAIGTLGKFGGVFRLVGGAASLLSLPVRAIGRAFGFAFGMIGKFAGLVPRVRTAITNGVLDFLIRLPSRFHTLGLRMAQRLVDALVGGIRKLPGLLGEIFTKGLGVAGSIGRGMANWLNENTPLGDKVDLPGPLPDFRLPALAAGGNVGAAGAVLIGERGPEVLNLPKGATVSPLPKRGPLANAGAAAAALMERPIQLVVDGRTLAEVTARQVRNAQNRR